MATPPNAYAAKLCPLLSAQMMRPKESSVLTADGQKHAEQMKGVPCQGPACAFYLNVNEGQKQGGQCSLALLPFAVSMLGNQLCEMAANIANAVVPPKPEEQKGT